MKIEDVEKLAYEFEQVRSHVSDVDMITVLAFQSLRAEAWHPIEKADELGAKAEKEDGNFVLIYCRIHDDYPGMYWAPAYWREDVQGWLDGYGNRQIGVTHFRFINPPEGA